MPRDTTMTRRHFELIAGVINALDLGIHPTDMAATRLAIAHDFSRCLEQSNQSFNREMFINACTVSDRKREVKRVATRAAGQQIVGSGAEKLTKRADAVGAAVNETASLDNERFDH